MKWPWSTEKKSAAAQSTKTIVASDSLSSFLDFGRKEAATPRGALSLYDDSTAVSIPINFIADAFASITPILKNQEDEIIKDHEVLDLLKKPSPFFTKSLFLQSLGKNFLITGDASVIAIGDIRRPPLEIQPMSSAEITANKGDAGYANSYIIGGTNLQGNYVLKIDKRQARYFDGTRRELAMIRNFSTRDNSLLRGQSPLVSAASEARQHIFGMAHNVSVLEKGGKLQMIFHYEEECASMEEFDDLKERVHDQYGGTNGEAIGVSTGGKMNVQTLGVSNRDMDYVNMQNLARQSIASQYKVPLPLIFMDASTLNNYKTGVIALYDDAVLPLADYLLGGLSDMLLPRYGLDPSKIRITYDPLSITALMERTLEHLKARKDIGIETDNEMRDMMGRESIEGGNVIYKPANLLPVGTDLFTADE